MAISILNGFDYGGQSYDFTRQGFATLEEMANYPSFYLPKLYIALCEETGKPYLYNVSNEMDTEHGLGKWRELSGSGSGADMLNYYTKQKLIHYLNQRLIKKLIRAYQLMITPMKKNRKYRIQQMPLQFLMVLLP